MSETNYTPIQLYRSTTGSQLPSAINLADGELAINMTDEKLYFKNTSGSVKLLAANLMPVANGGTGVTTSTGSGSVVLSTSPTLVTPTLVTPVLGTPASGDFSTGTFTWPTFNQNTTGTANNITAYTINQNVGTSNSPSFSGLTLSGGTANGIPYLNGSKVLTTGSALTFDGSSFVTTAASTAYSKVRSSGSGTVAASLYQNADTGTTDSDGLFVGVVGNVPYIYNYENSPLLFGTNAAERMRIDSSGNLGVGVTPSAWHSAYKAIQAGVGASFAGSTSAANDAYLSANWCYSSGDKYIGTGYSTIYQQTSGKHIWYTAPSGTAGNAITFTQAMTLDSSGNLGIGTTVPNQKLEVLSSGDCLVRVTGGSGNAKGIEFYKGSGNPTQLYNVSDDLRVFTAGFERMRLDSSGNLGIGTASPASKLHVNGQDIYLTGTTDNRIRFSNYGFTGNSMGAAIGYIYGIANTQEQGSLAFYTNPNYNGSGSLTERMRIDSSGNLLINTTDVDAGIGGNVGVTQFSFRAAAEGFRMSSTGSAYYNVGNGVSTQYIYWKYAGATVGNIAITSTSVGYNTSSDYRLKNTIAPMTDALAKVALLKPVTYKWNADGSDGEGFIAHELAEVCPQAVTGEKDAVDAEGNPVYQGIDTSFLVATLTAAIQELKAEFDAYKASHP